MCAYATLAFQLLLMEAISLSADYTLLLFMLFVPLGAKLGDLLYYWDLEKVFMFIFIHISLF
jgi:hypothetical protein